MDELKLELNGKTAIFPLKNGINFLGFHTYLDSGGAVVMKLRRDSIRRMKDRIKGWKEDFPAGKISREKIVVCWKAWDAHAAHGDTYALRQKMAAEVSAIIGVRLTARRKIRKSKYDDARKMVKNCGGRAGRSPAKGAKRRNKPYGKRGIRSKGCGKRC